MTIKNKSKTELALMGAIFPEDVDKCRQRVKIGDAFNVADNSWKCEKGNGVRPIRCGRVIAKYPHFVILDCGTSITYVQIIQYRRKRGRNKFVD